MKPLRLLSILPWLVLPIASGCASLIGLEGRIVKDSDGGGVPNASGGNPNEVVDKETGRKTSELCIEYCDTVAKNCTGDHAQYVAREPCIDTCNALPEGDSEPTENTMRCRLFKAQRAASAPDEVCNAAGPAGVGSCGTNCEAWCSLLQKACPEEYDPMPDCLQSCTGLKDDPTYQIASAAEAPNLQCRIYHLTVALDNPDTHCGHGAYVSTLHCGDVGPTPNCNDYCDHIMANCPETDDVKTNSSVYETRGDCLAACKAFPVGTLDDRKDANSLGCHYYHANLATSGRAPHCAHAGPSGEGACLADKEDESGNLVSSENCDSYCWIYETGCEGDFDAKFKSHEECVTNCASTFDTNGARSNTTSIRAKGSPFYYVAKTAPLTDTLQCRIYHAVKAAAGDSDACMLAAADSACGE